MNIRKLIKMSCSLGFHEYEYAINYLLSGRDRKRDYNGYWTLLSGGYLRTDAATIYAIRTCRQCGHSERVYRVQYFCPKRGHSHYTDWIKEGSLWSYIY